MIFAELNTRRLSSQEHIMRGEFGINIFARARGKREREKDRIYREGCIAGMVPKRFGRYRAPFVLREAEYP